MEERKRDDPDLTYRMPRARLSSGTKMFAAILLGLLPLGILALLAAAEAMRTAEADRRALLNIAEREISYQISGEMEAAITSVGYLLRDRQTGQAGSEWIGRVCERAVQWRSSAAIDPELFVLRRDNGIDRCNMGLSANHRDLLSEADRTQAFLSEQRQSLVIPIAAPDPEYRIMLVLPRELLISLSRPSSALPPFDLGLTDGATDLLLVNDADRTDVPGASFQLQKPVGQTPLTLTLTARRVDFDRNQLVTLATPVLMWLLAAALSWIILNWMILRPMQRLQRNVSQYEPGNVLARIPHRVTTELTDLQDSFSRMAERVADDKTALDAAIVHQQALTREVHHRVKNNLQIVASLISLYSRDARDAEAKQAFRTIQRRVDALSVVHRNHFAALEQGAGIAARPLFAELQSALGQPDANAAAAGAIDLDIAALRVSQDVALPISFLLTELVELARGSDPSATVAVRLRSAADEPEMAELIIRSDAFRTESAEQKLTSGHHGRILTGLARQLRQTLRHEPGQDSFSITIPTIDGAA